MTPRLCLALALAATTSQSVLAQESVLFQWTWTDVVAGTTVPVASPNGVLEPGEGAMLRLTAQISHPIGAPASHLGMNGFIAGLSNIFFDLVGFGVAEGQWAHVRAASGFTTLGSTPAAGGRNLLANQAFQMPLPGNPAHSSNPVVDLWSAVWTPSSYALGYTYFEARRAEAAGPGSTGAQILLDVGGAGPSLYLSKPVDATFGSILISIPSPATGALLFGVGLLAVARRRR